MTSRRLFWFITLMDCKMSNLHKSFCDFVLLWIKMPNKTNPNEKKGIVLFSKALTVLCCCSLLCLTQPQSWCWAPNRTQGASSQLQMSSLLVSHHRLIVKS